MIRVRMTQDQIRNLMAAGWSASNWNAPKVECPRCGVTCARETHKKCPATQEHAREAAMFLRPDFGPIRRHIHE